MKRLLSRLIPWRLHTADHSSDKRVRARLGNSLEPLEARVAPAALATFSKGTLLITGTPDGALDFEQTSEEVAGAVVITTTVTDNGTPLAGKSSFTGVKNIVVKLPKALTADSDLSFDLLKLTGAVEVLAPKAANTSVSISGPGTDGPHIGKGILFKGGSGIDSLALNGVTVGKGIAFVAGKGADQFFAAGDVIIKGSVSALGVPTFTLSAGAEITGQLLITQKENFTEFYVLGANAKIGGNVQIYAGPGSTTINAYATVKGHFFAFANSGPNNFNVALTAKSLTYVGGGDNDFVSLMAGNVSGSVKLGLGGGRNDIGFNIGPILGDFVVGKKLTIQGGSGIDNYRLDSNSAKVRVGGDTFISLSSGNNAITWNGVSTGKKIEVNGSSGMDTVNLFNLNATASTLFVNLSSGDDRILLSDGFLKARLNGGSGTDTVIAGSVLPANAVLKSFEVGVG